MEDVNNSEDSLQLSDIGEMNRIRNNKQPQTQGEGQNNNLTETGNLQKQRKQSLLSGKLNNLKGKVKDVKNLATSFARKVSYGWYKLTADPAVIGETFGILMVIWWPFHFVAKYMARSRYFSKFAPLYKPDAINIKEILEDKESTSFLSFVILGFIIGITFLLIMIISVFITILVKAGEVASIWRIFTDTKAWLEDVGDVIGLIKDIIK